MENKRNPDSYDYAGLASNYSQRKNKSLLGEFWSYMKIRKKWWLLPLIIMLLLVGLLFIIGSGNNILSPLVYALL